MAIQIISSMNWTFNRLCFKPVLPDFSLDSSNYLNLFNKKLLSEFIHLFLCILSRLKPFMFC